MQTKSLFSTFRQLSFIQQKGWPIFKVMRLILPAGKNIPEHKAPKEISVQCVAGTVDFTTMGKTHSMTASSLLHLPPGELHSLLAIEDSVMLITMAK